jgi:hypothetical protein
MGIGRWGKVEETGDRGRMEERKKEDGNGGAKRSDSDF